MTLVKRKSKFKWQVGDVITPDLAADLLGYKSTKNLQDEKRLNNLKKQFEAAGATLTTDIWIGRRRRFLRSEIDNYLSLLVGNAQAAQSDRQMELAT